MTNMAKKSPDTDSLTAPPWWLTLIIAGLAYVALRFVLPNVEYNHPTMATLARSAADFAGAIALLLLASSLIALLLTRRRQKRDE